MTRDGIAGLFNINRSVTSLGSGARLFRLPSLNPFPKMDSRTARPAAGGTLAAGLLPEMVSDLIDESTVYAVENVKRDRPRTSGLDGRGWDTGRREARP